MATAFDNGGPSGSPGLVSAALGSLLFFISSGRHISRNDFRVFVGFTPINDTVLRRLGQTRLARRRSPETTAAVLVKPGHKHEARSRTTQNGQSPLRAPGRLARPCWADSPAARRRRIPFSFLSTELGRGRPSWWRRPKCYPFLIKEKNLTQRTSLAIHRGFRSRPSFRGRASPCPPSRPGRRPSSAFVRLRAGEASGPESRPVHGRCLPTPV